MEKSPARIPILGTRSDLLPGLLLALLVGVVYAPALGYGLVWDDAFHFASNPHLDGLRGLWRIWTSRAGLYYPLTLTTFWGLKQVVGLTPWIYHLVTVAFHAGTAVLAWLWLRALGVHGAWLGAALFALHPLQVESVAWVTELKNAQSGFFFLLCLLLLERRCPRSALLSFVAALLSKTSTVMLPVVVLGVAWWRATAGGASPWTALRAAWTAVAPLQPYFVLALLAGGWTIWEQLVSSGARGAEWDYGWRLRGAVAGQAVWFYFFKFLWPHPLCFIYPRWSIDVTEIAAFLPAAALAGLLLCLWFIPQRAARHALAGLGFFLVVLFPVLGFFNIYFSRYAFVSDHFAYLPLLGLGALAAALVYGLPAPARRLAAAALVTGCAALTQQRLPAFRDEAALWADTLQKNPGAWMVLNNIGAGRQAQGDLAGARWYYEEALRHNPGHYEALVNLGSVLLDQDDPAAAVARYQHALELKPGYPVALVNLGLALSRLGRVDEALARFREALAVQPDLIDAHVKAAGVLERVGRFEEAAREWQAALDLKGSDAAGTADFFRKRAAEFERLQQPVASELYRRRGGRRPSGERPSGDTH